MAVSKIAVMALVGILAVPILLGYAFNLSEVSGTEYKPSGESVNVTQMLQNSVIYTQADLDAHYLNNNFSNPVTKVTPIYNTIGPTKTTVPINQWLYDGVNQPTTSVPWDLDLWKYSYVSNLITKPLSNGYFDLQIIDADDSSVFYTIYKVRSFYWDYQTLKFSFSYYTNDDLTSSNSNYIYLPDPNYYYHSITHGDFNAERYLQRAILPQYAGTETLRYADLSAGYYFEGSGENYRINVPEKTSSILMTLNLDSITDDNYRLLMSVLTPAYVDLVKTTTDGVVNWKIGGPNQNLFYDSDRTDNTYQIKLEYEYVGPYVYNLQPDIPYSTYHVKVKYNYVGGWPAIIGEANPYKTYEYEYDSHTAASNSYDYIQIYGSGDNNFNRTPTMRIDEARSNAFPVSVIEDKTYNPADFRTNPTTTISNTQRFGDSLEFGGNTYNVDSKGDITLGTHKVSVNGLKLESLPVAVGYENKINGNVVSVTADPSDIKFNGPWLASVSTDGNTATTYTKTEWNAGSFAWDGIDQNFLMVGLITCLGVFIALGIYLRKTGKGLMPLLIVCGCAAGLFFCMI